MWAFAPKSSLILTSVPGGFLGLLARLRRWFSTRGGGLPPTSLSALRPYLLSPGIGFPLSRLEGASLCYLLILVSPKGVSSVFGCLCLAVCFCARSPLLSH